MKTTHTNKLFWNKFTYKITLRIPSISNLRDLSKKDAEYLVTSDSYEQWMMTRKRICPSLYIPSYDKDASEWIIKREKRLWKNRFVVYKLFEFLNEMSLQGIDFNKRIENDKISIAFNDEEYFNKGCSAFAHIISEIAWPKDQTIANYLLANPDHEIVKKYPYRKFQYKINLRSYFRQARGKGEIKKWIKQYDGIKVSDLTLEELDKGFTTNGKFLYVTDQKMMLLLELALGETIKSTTTYKLESEIK